MNIEQQYRVNLSDIVVIDIEFSSERVDLWLRWGQAVKRRDVGVGQLVEGT